LASSGLKDGADVAVVQPREGYLYGPETAWGLAAALLVCAADQALKLWLVFGFDLARRGFVPILPTIDFVLTWNKGISYGLFQQNSDLGQWALVAFKLIAVVALWIWLARAGSRLTAVALGLIIGGALGNVIDRIAHGAVADFILFHIETAIWQFRWYVFNLADAAIVVGVVLLLYEALFPPRAAKAP
jgi:signal peptidase II